MLGNCLPNSIFTVRAPHLTKCSSFLNQFPAHLFENFNFIFSLGVKDSNAELMNDNDVGTVDHDGQIFQLVADPSLHHLSIS